MALTSNEFRPAIADNSKHDEYLTATWWCLLTILTGLAAQYEDVPGSYCMAITVTDDIAMALGQERFGFPKKLAQIQLGQAGSETVGFVERNGVRFFKLEFSHDEQAVDASLKTLLQRTIQVKV